jgi:tetratricopeptide (TPR) repeat protein
VLRTALRLGALCALCVLAGCAAAPAGRPLRDSNAAAPEPDPLALEREADGYAAQGRRDLAAPLYARLIELRAADEERVPKSRALSQLAVVEHDRGQLDEAEDCYRRALAEEFAEGGRDPGLRTRALANLAWLLGERGAWSVEIGRTADAVGFYQQALEIWETLQPASDALVAESLANLALLDRARGDHRSARERLERALPLYEKSLAADDPTLLRLRALLADGGPRRDPPPASPAPEPDPATVARDLDREGAACLDRREFARARALLERAVAIHERGVTAPVELGASLSYLGRSYAGLGEREPARSALERSLALLEPALGKLDPLTLATRASLENVRAQAPSVAP